MDLQQQLADLRQRIRSIDRKYEAPASPPPRPGPILEEFVNGRAVETGAGSHFEAEHFYPRHQRHGCSDISALAELPAERLGPISGDTIRATEPARWAFLDTETTGLGGGSGTCAFLVGVGRITADGFRVRQFFMRDHGEEPSVLEALSAHLGQFDVLITYNGLAFDQPLLETRYRLNRRKPPFGSLAHLDLLHGARRLWRLRLDSCRLVDLESQILGYEREGDIAGAMIPYVYFEYLRTRQAFRIVPVFRHNALDILTLACLTDIVSRAFQSPEGVELAHGAELVGMGRWLMRAGRPEASLDLLRRAVDRGLPDALLFRTLWDVGLLEKRLGNESAAIAVFTDLAAVPGPHRAAALEELAKHYEHGAKDYRRAAELTETALGIRDSAGLELRLARLERLARRARPPARARKRAATVKPSVP